MSDFRVKGPFGQYGQTPPFDSQSHCGACGRKLKTGFACMACGHGAKDANAELQRLRGRLARLEDGIRTLAAGKEGVAQVARQSGDEDTALRAERDAAELRGLLGGE